MPRYLYNCRNCNIHTEAIHSYRTLLTECTHCGDKEGLYKDLSTPITTQANLKKPPSKVGLATKSAIEAARQEIKVTKKHLKSRNKK